tara:strand:+ start:339 stop:1874 length:1536 start_codon:yes stop_codon:yes gene_type:complete
VAIFDNSSSNWRSKNAQFWSGISEFYQKKGIDSWDRLVPHQITNNPEFAHTCAKLIAHYMLDCEQKGYSGRFTIIEPGAGLGKFAFHFIKELTSLLSISSTQSDLFRYVITDTSDQSIQFWTNHPQLKPYFESGTLVASRLYVDETLTVQFDLESLPRQDKFILLANYCFDSLYQSPFQYHNHAFVPCSIEHKPPSLTNQDGSVHYKPIPSAPRPFADCSFYDRILDEHYALGAERTLMPDGPIALIHWLDALNDHPLLIVASDKGFTNFTFDQYASNFNIIQTGTYASSVNFFALGRYIELALDGSKFFGPADQVQFGTHLFLTHASIHEYANLNLEGHSTISTVGTYAKSTTNLLTAEISLRDPYDFFNYLSSQRFAPFSLAVLYDHLETALQNCDILDSIDVDRVLNELLGNYYFTPHETSVVELACIGNLALMAKKFSFAKSLLDLFLKFHGTSYQYHRLMGNYFFLQSEFASAAHHFTESLSINPECESSKTFLQHCEALVEPAVI